MEVIHNTHQQLAIGITSTLLFLTTLVVAIRLYIRCILLKAGSAGWDDLTVFIAWVGARKDTGPRRAILIQVEQVMAVGASIATYFGRHTIPDGLVSHD